MESSKVRGETLDFSEKEKILPDSLQFSEDMQRFHSNFFTNCNDELNASKQKDAEAGHLQLSNDMSVDSLEETPNEKRQAIEDEEMSFDIPKSDAEKKGEDGNDLGDFFLDSDSSSDKSGLIIDLGSISEVPNLQQNLIEQNEIPTDTSKQNDNKDDGPSNIDGDNGNVSIDDLEPSGFERLKRYFREENEMLTTGSEQNDEPEEAEEAMETNSSCVEKNILGAHCLQFDETNKDEETVRAVHQPRKKGLETELAENSKYEFQFSSENLYKNLEEMFVQKKPVRQVQNQDQNSMDAGGNKCYNIPFEIDFTTEMELEDLLTLSDDEEEKQMEAYYIDEYNKEMEPELEKIKNEIAEKGQSGKFDCNIPTDEEMSDHEMKDMQKAMKDLQKLYSDDHDDEEDVNVLLQNGSELKQLVENKLREMNAKKEALEKSTDALEDKINEVYMEKLDIFDGLTKNLVELPKGQLTVKWMIGKNKKRMNILRNDILKNLQPNSDINLPLPEPKDKYVMMTFFDLEKEVEKSKKANKILNKKTMKFVESKEKIVERIHEANQAILKEIMELENYCGELKLEEMKLKR